MRIRSIFAVLAFSLVLGSSGMALAELTAHFNLTRILNFERKDSSHGSCDGCDCNLPFSGVCKCDFSLEAAIFVGTTRIGSQIWIPGSCSNNEICEGTWNFTDTELVRTLSAGATDATFYVSLFDDDGFLSGDDDLLGSHQATWSGSSGGRTEWNTDSMPTGYTPQSCDDAGSWNDNSSSSRFQLEYSAWFEDDDAPSPPDSITHTDNANAGWDNDTTLNFSWSGASDLDSGISGYHIDIWEDGSQSVFNLLVTGTSVTICSSGCDLTHTISNNSRYRIQVSAINGGTIGLSSTRESSEFTGSWVTIDTTNPTTSFAAGTPGATSWVNSGFRAYFTDSDANTLTCFFQVRNDGNTPSQGDASWDDRSCSASDASGVAVTVGSNPANDCATPGVYTDNVCRIWTGVSDAAGNWRQTWRRFGVDYTQDRINSLQGRENGGDIRETLPHNDWTTDDTPFFSYSFNSGSETAEVTRFYRQIRSGADLTDPGCTGLNQSIGSAVSSGNYSPSALTEGWHRFWVHTYDQAGNCGVGRAHDFGIDQSADTMQRLRYTGSGDWVNAVPTVQWDTTEPNYSPIIGYVWDTADLNGCASPSNTLSTTPAGLSEGRNTFYVRPVDTAGNCGATSSIVIDLDRQQDIIGTIQANGGAIATRSWQQDITPTFSWAEPSSTADVNTYSWDVLSGDVTPADGDLNRTGNSVDPGPAVTPADLADGIHTFVVRPNDDAGNWGPISSFVVYVDSQGDTIGDLTVLTESGGDPLPAAPTWQEDNQPFFSWTVGTTHAPNSSVTIAIDEPAATCGGDGTTSLPANRTTFQWPDTLSDGEHTIYVRALDAAGNCGTAATATFRVLATPPSLNIAAAIPNPALEGDVIEIRVTASNSVPLPAAPTVTIDGNAAELTGFIPDGDWTYTYTVTGDEVEPGVGGLAEIAASATNQVGATGTASANITVDFKAPGPVDGFELPAVVTSGDVLTILWEADETLGGTPDVLVDDDSPATLETQDGDNFIFVYNVTGGEGEGVVDVIITMVDVAGNDASYVASFDLDLTEPTVRVDQPDNSERWVINWGDDFELQWTTTDDHPDTVDIYFSTNSGETWELLAEDLEDTGSYTWTAPTDLATSNGYFRVIATDEVGYEGSADSLYPVRVRDPIADHVRLLNLSGDTVVGEDATISVLIVDEIGDSVEVATDITIVVDGDALITGTTLEGAVTGGNQVSGTTAADGTATLDITDGSSETVRVTPNSGTLPANASHISTTIDFVPERPDHLIVAVDDGVANVGELERLTIVAVDRNGNPTDSDVDVRVTVSGNGVVQSTNLRSAIGIGGGEVFGRLNDSGTATVDVTDIIAENVLVTASSDSLTNVRPDEGAEVLFAQLSEVDPLGIEVTAVPPTVYANDIAFSLITITPHNAAGDIFGGGMEVEVFTSGGRLDEVEDLGNGNYQTQLRSDTCFDDPVTIDVRIEDVLIRDAAEVTFTCVSVESAVVTVDPATIVADGVTCAGVQITLFDEDGNRIEDAFVAVTSTYGDIEPADEDEGTGGLLPDDSGVYAASLCSDICADDAITVTAEVNGIPLTDVAPDLLANVVVECLGVDPGLSVIEVNPRSIIADGMSTSTVTVTPVRLDGEGMGAGHAVEVMADLGDLTTVFDVGDGTYTAQLTSLVDGESRVTASVTGRLLNTHEIVTILPFTPEGGSVTLAAGSVTGLADAFEVDLQVTNIGIVALSDFSIHIQTAEGVALDALSTTWTEGSVTITLNGATGEWELNLGDLALLAEGGTAPSLHLALTSSGTPGAELIARGFQADNVVSDTLVIPLDFTSDGGDDGYQEGQTTVDACSCTTTRSPATRLWLLLGLMSAVLVYRRRRGHLG